MTREGQGRTEVDGDDVETGGEPETVAQCTECGEIYPVQETGDSSLRPVGVEGGCECGNDRFEALSTE